MDSLPCDVSGKDTAGVESLKKDNMVNLFTRRGLSFEYTLCVRSSDIGDHSVLATMTV